MKRTFPAKVIEEEQRVIMTTAAAQAPAPGKLEFKDDYTPDEAERVIRNSKGLPVGVRPKWYGHGRGPAVGRHRHRMCLRMGDSGRLAR